MPSKVSRGISTGVHPGCFYKIILEVLQQFSREGNLRNSSLYNSGKNNWRDARGITSRNSVTNSGISKRYPDSNSWRNSEKNYGHPKKVSGTRQCWEEIFGRFHEKLGQQSDENRYEKFWRNYGKSPTKRSNTNLWKLCSNLESIHKIVKRSFLGMNLSNELHRMFQDK